MSGIKSSRVSDEIYVLTETIECPGLPARKTVHGYYEKLEDAKEMLDARFNWAKKSDNVVVVLCTTTCVYQLVYILKDCVSVPTRVTLAVEVVGKLK